MPKRKAPKPLAVCPETYLESFEQAFDEAAEEAMQSRSIPKGFAEDTRIRLLDMKESVMTAIRDRVELADDPAAEAVPRALNRGLVMEIDRLERRADELAASVKRMRQAVGAEVMEAAEAVGSAAEQALTAPVEEDTDAGDETDDAAAAAAASSASSASSSILDAAASLKKARGAVSRQAAAVRSAEQAVAMAMDIGTTGTDRAAAGKGAV